VLLAPRTQDYAANATCAADTRPTTIVSSPSLTVVPSTQHHHLVADPAVLTDPRRTRH
jgi:hypothetical protein